MNSQKALKVALVTAFPEDPTHPCGGVEAVSVNLAAALASRPDTEVHVITARGQMVAPEVSSWQGATVHRLPAPKGPVLVTAVGAGRKQILGYLKALCPDVVHAHDTYGLMVQGLEMPKVFTIHGFIYEDTLYEGGWKSWMRSRLWKRIETKGWARQAHVISISPYVRERLRGIASGTIHDIENPIAPASFTMERKEALGTIFCAASICQRKNILGLARAFAILAKKFPEARLRLAGGIADADYELSVREFLAGEGISERVEWLGPASTVRVREELAGASIFALLSYEEGAPMGIAEALAAGVPVVTSNRCGMPYMVRHGETGFLISPDDAQSAADKFSQILRDRSLAQQMGEQARTESLNRYHPDRVAERTRRVYAQAVSEFERNASPVKNSRRPSFAWS